jgi:hypothetical protein
VTAAKHETPADQETCLNDKHWIIWRQALSHP